MATIAEQITTLNQVKTDIKNKLLEKGADMNNVPFTSYAGKIDTLRISSGNAAASDVLSGKTFSNSSGSLTGTMTNNGAVSKSFTPSAASQSYTIPAGYHNGSGVVTVAATPTSLIDGDATTANVLKGKTFFVDSFTKKTGTMVNRTDAATIKFASGNDTKVIEGNASFVAKNSDDVTRFSVRFAASGGGYITSNTLFGINVLDIDLNALQNAINAASPIQWRSMTGTLASSGVSGSFNPAWLTDDVCGTKTVTFNYPTKITSVYLHCGTRRVDNGGWCNGRVTLTGKTTSGSTITLLNKYTDFDRNGKTVSISNTNEFSSITWTWYTPDSTWRDYNVDESGSISAWQEYR